MRTNEAGLKLIKEFEGLKLTAYVCPAGKLTIGYGDTQHVTPGMVISQFEADDRLNTRISAIEAALIPAISTELNDNQFSAIVSLAYNVGVNSIKNSTLIKLINANHLVGAAAQFPRWNYVNGVQSAGLTRRRAAERALFEAAV